MGYDVFVGSGFEVNRFGSDFLPWSDQNQKSSVEWRVTQFRRGLLGLLSHG